MNKIIKGLLEYLKNTPKDQIEKDFEKTKEYSKVGPTVEEYLQGVMKPNRNEDLSEKAIMRYFYVAFAFLFFIVLVVVILSIFLFSLFF